MILQSRKLQCKCNMTGNVVQLFLSLSLSRWVTLITLLLRNSRLHNSVSMATLGGRSQSVQLGMFKGLRKAEKWRSTSLTALCPDLLFLFCTYVHLLPVFTTVLLLFLNQCLLYSTELCSVQMPYHVPHYLMTEETSWHGSVILFIYLFAGKR